MLDRHAPGVGRGLQVGVPDIVELGEEFVNGTGGLHPHIEFIGLREQIALETGCLSGFYALKKAVVILIGGGGIHQILCLTDTVFFETLKHLAHGKALGQCDENRLAGTGADAHMIDKRAVIIA